MTDRLNFFITPQKKPYATASDLAPNFSRHQYYPPLVTIIRGFAQHPGHADDAEYDCIEGVITESLPADEFITYTELGIILVSFEPWDKHTDNWADRPDNFCFSGKMPIR